MARGNDVLFRLLGESTSFVKATGEASKAGDRLKSRLKGLIGPTALLAGVGGLGAVTSSAFGLSQELSGLQDKSRTVFGDSLGDVRNWADSVKRNFGLSRNEVLGLATNMGDLLKPMGFTTEQAGTMSTEVLGLAGALSEWSNGQQSVADVSDILTKAMLGEREGLKQLGISINQAEVDTRALAMARAEGRDEITQMDRALATQTLILEKSTDAQAAYEAGGNSLIRAQNTLRSVVTDLRDRFVLALIPALERVVVVGGQAIAWAKANKDVLLAVGVAVGVLAGAAGIAKLISAMKAAKAAALAFNLVLAANPIGVTVAAIAALAAGLVILYNRSETFREIVQSVWEWVQKAADVVRDFAEDALVVAQAAFERISPIINAYIGILRGLIDFVTSVFTGNWSGAWQAIQDIAGSALDLVAGLFNLWKELMLRAIITAAEGLASVGVQLWQWLIDGFAALPGLIVDAIGNVAGLLLNVGQDLVQGIVDGIRSAPGRIRDAIADLIPGSGLIGRAAGVIPFFGNQAEGGVFAPNNFGLIGIGDNTREPEIVSPVSTMRAAMAAELAAHGGLGGNTTVVLEMDGREFARTVLDTNARNARLTGVG